MIDFTFTEEQEMFRQAAREFAEGVVAPKVAEMEESPQVNDDVLQGLGQAEMMALTIPEEYGGLGLGYTTRLIALEEIVDQAEQRWKVLGTAVIHRVGELRPSDQIVLVAVASAHRGDAFAACAFIMDYLKTRAPFWKKELLKDGSSRWVEAIAREEAADSTRPSKFYAVEPPRD